MFLDNEIHNRRIALDKSRLQPLLDTAEPKMFKELKQVHGLFAYNAKCIADFSTKLKPLTDTEGFPLSSNAQRPFGTLKDDLGQATLMSIGTDLNFVNRPTPAT